MSHLTPARSISISFSINSGTRKLSTQRHTSGTPVLVWPLSMHSASLHTRLEVVRPTDSDT